MKLKSCQLCIERDISKRLVDPYTLIAILIIVSFLYIWGRREECEEEIIAGPLPGQKQNL